jgi:hypothetical protein
MQIRAPEFHAEFGVSLQFISDSKQGLRLHDARFHKVVFSSPSGEGDMAELEVGIDVEFQLRMFEPPEGAGAERDYDYRIIFRDAKGSLDIFELVSDWIYDFFVDELEDGRVRAEIVIDKGSTHVFTFGSFHEIGLRVVE